MAKLRVFVGADVLFAGSASTTQYGASQTILTLSEMGIIAAITSQQAVTEARRNLRGKVPKALPAFNLIVSRALEIVPDPAEADIRRHQGIADPKDLPILVAALRAECRWLVTFNLRHFHPGHPDVVVLQPGDLVQRVRQIVTTLR